VKQFYSGRIASKLIRWQNIQVYSPKTPLLSINSTKLRENGKSDKMAPNTIPRSKNPNFIWSKTKDLEGNILQTAFHLLADKGTSKLQKRFAGFKGCEYAHAQ
jgi:hypothetical protein